LVHQQGWRRSHNVDDCLRHDRENMKMRLRVKLLTLQDPHPWPEIQHPVLRIYRTTVL
jgi:hypothetical protein